MGPLQIIDVKEDIVSISQDTNLIIYEDLAQELEDFIYLSRLGCKDEATKLYNAALKPHHYKHFPIALEYLEVQLTWLAQFHDMTLENDPDSVGDIYLPRLVEAFEGQEERAVIKLYDTFNSTLHKELRDSPVSSFSISIVLTTLEHLVIDKSEDQFNPTLWHIHEFTLRIHLQTRRLSFEDRKLLYPFYQRCCGALHKISQTWQAFQLLVVTASDMPSGKVISAYRTLFEVITEDYSKSISELDQPVKLAYLNGLVHYIFVTADRHESLNELLRGSNMQPRYCKTEAEQLFDYFFNGLAKAQGALFDLLQNKYDSEDSDSETESDISTSTTSAAALLYQLDYESDEGENSEINDTEEPKRHDEEEDSPHTDDKEVSSIEKAEKCIDKDGDDDGSHDTQVLQNFEEKTKVKSVNQVNDASNSNTLGNLHITVEIQETQDISKTKDKEQHIDPVDLHVAVEAQHMPNTEGSSNNVYPIAGDTKANKITGGSQASSPETEVSSRQHRNHHAILESAPDTEESESSKTSMDQSKSSPVFVFDRSKPSALYVSDTTLVMDNVISPAILDDFGLAWEFTEQLGEIRIIEPISEAEKNALASYTKNLQDRHSLQTALDNFTRRKETRKLRERSRLNGVNAVNSQQESARPFFTPSPYTATNNVPNSYNTPYPYNAPPVPLYHEPTYINPSYPMPRSYVPPNPRPVASYPVPHHPSYYPQAAYPYYDPPRPPMRFESRHEDPYAEEYPRFSTRYRVPAYEVDPYREEDSQAKSKDRIPKSNLSQGGPRTESTIHSRGPKLNADGSDDPRGEPKFPSFYRPEQSQPRLRSGSDTRDRSHSVDYIQRMVEREIPILGRGQSTRIPSTKRVVISQNREDDGGQFRNEIPTPETVVMRSAKRQD